MPHNLAFFLSFLASFLGLHIKWQWFSVFPVSEGRSSSRARRFKGGVPSLHSTLTQLTAQSLWVCILEGFSFLVQRWEMTWIDLCRKYYLQRAKRELSHNPFNGVNVLLTLCSHQDNVLFLHYVYFIGHLFSFSLQITYPIFPF